MIHNVACQIEANMTIEVPIKWINLLVIIIMVEQNINLKSRSTK